MVVAGADAVISVFVIVSGTVPVFVIMTGWLHGLAPVAVILLLHITVAGSTDTVGITPDPVNASD